MEELLRKLSPNGDFSKELSGSACDIKLEEARNANSMETMQEPSTKNPIIDPNCLTMLTTAISNAGNPPPNGGDFPPGEDEFADVELLDQLARLGINPIRDRFFGKSSGITLIQSAMRMKKAYTGVDHGIFGDKKSGIWRVFPWEISHMEITRPGYVFPEADLMSNLICLYFDNANLYLPLLHRPTFERSVAGGLHLDDDAFGATVLLVCAIGSRYSNDRRVYVTLEGPDWVHSSGWKWFNQAHKQHCSPLKAPSVYDLQFYALSVLFLQSASAPQASWTMVGIGVRLAQEIGAHRHNTNVKSPSAEYEIQKRAFWSVSIRSIFFFALNWIGFWFF
jgi:hypothetical protein